MYLFKKRLSGEFKAFILIIAICTLSFSVYSQVMVSGVIRDATDNYPLPGVNILEKGTKNGVISNIDGEFELTVASTSSVLQFSFIGYETQEIIVGNRRTFDIKLSPATTLFEEVITVGYGGRGIRRNRSKAVYDMEVSAFYIPAPQQPSHTYFNPSVETYSLINENGFSDALTNPLSTFSISVDNASYANVRRFINNGQMPPPDAVRIEEMLNYFTYEYAQPKGEHPFAVTAEYADCPWQPEHKLLHIGLQGKDIPLDDLPPSNLVFLIDVSGSMAPANRLPLVKTAFKMLVNNLRETDRVSIVVYASQVGVVLPSTPGSEKEKINRAIDGLVARGSTAGGDGIQKAYEVAVKNFIPGGNNRVILATDGDFNVGISNENELKRFIETKRETGVYLTCLGFGMGNFKDSRMEILSRAGNGNYAYIDNIQEAQKVFIQEFGGTLFTIADDVKLQIDFNPAKVQAYRLIGYENRMLNAEDFKDDTKDAGEIGAGHTVTAIYEIIPAGLKSEHLPQTDASVYQRVRQTTRNHSHEVATVRIRYKNPGEDKSLELRHPVEDRNLTFNRASENFRFSAAVAMFGMHLRNSDFKGKTNLKEISEITKNARKYDPYGYRGEFLRMVETAGSIENLSQNR
ncbi:hypothetical protein CDL62_03215 [Alkalitalea saponilacus]|nr:hypothetical protein CDL62_03215 [Alkalitalea saponilacus]